MKTRKSSAWAITVVLLSVAGCGVNPETIESLRSAVNTVASSPSSAGAGESARPQASAAKTAAFVPAYPDRTDPFVFPGGEQPGARETPSLTTIAEVEVLGFAKVGQQHVLLRSGDNSRSLRVGDSIDGIRVVAINPPSVQLQLGTLLWTATMFDKKNGE